MDSTITISNTVTYGTTPFTYTYSAQSGLTVTGNTVTTSTPGTYTLTENAIDSVGIQVQSNQLSLTFNALPTVSVTGTTVADVGQSITLNASATGIGLTYQWYNDTNAISTSNNPSAGTANFVETAGATGTFNYQAVVTDVNGEQATSTPANVVVVSNVPIITITANVPSVDVGQYIAISNTVTYGTTPFTYTYSAQSGLTVTGNTVTASTPGTYTLTENAIDSVGIQVQSNQLSLTFNALPTVSVTGTTVADVGQSITLNASATGIGLTYQWYNDTNAISTSNNPSAGTANFVETAGATGTFNYQAVVTDVNGEQATSTPANVVVVSNVPIITITANVPSVDVGQYIAISNTVTYGTTPFTYTYSAQSGLTVTGNTVTASTPGTYTLTENAIDSVGIQVQSNQLSLTFNALPTVSVTGTTVADVGQSITLNASATGIGLTYQWYNDTNAISTSNNPSAGTANFVETAGATGTFNYQAVVTDVNGEQATSTPANVVVVSNVPIITITANVPSVDVGQYIAISNTTTYGTTPFTYTYSAQSGLTVTGNTVTTSTPGTYTLTENAIDSVGIQVQSNQLSLTFNALPTVSVTGTTVADVGQSITLNASATGIGLTYQWYNDTNAISTSNNPSAGTANFVETAGATGTFNYQAVVTDVNGEQATSTPANVVVVSNVPIITITANVPSVDVGQYIAISNTVTYGTTPFTYTYSAQSGLTVTGNTVTASTPGTYTLTENAIDSVGIQVQSNQLSLTFNALPTVSVTGTTVADVGQSITLNASATGIGLTYQWYNDTNAISTSNNPSAGTANFVETAGATGTFNYQAVVTDVNGEQATSTPANVVVVSNVPIITITANVPSVDVGQYIAISNTVTYGTTPFTYTYSAQSGLTVTGNTVTASTPGTYTLTENAIDSVGIQVQSNQLSLTFNALPTVSVTGTTVADVGQSITLNASATGIGLTYQWYNDTNAISTSNNPSAGTANFVETAGATGTFNYQAVVTDVNGEQATSTPANVVVVSNVPIITITANVPSVDVGQYIAISNTVTYGTTPFTYTYSAQSGLTVTGNTVTTSTPGTYTLTENAIDSVGIQVQSNQLSLTFNALPTVSVTGTTVADVGQSITLNASATGIGLTYQWYNDTNAISTSNNPSAGTANFVETAGATGTFNYQAVVTDVNGEQATSTPANVVVVSNVPIITITANVPSVDVGQYIAISNTVTYGTTPFTYTYSAQSGLTVTGNTVTASTPGTYTLTENAIDSVGIQVQSNQLSLTFNAVTLTVSVTGTNSVDQGQTITLTASAMGGTGSFSYKWYNDSTGMPALMSDSGTLTGTTTNQITETAGTPNTVVDYYVIVTDTGSNTTQSTPDFQVVVSDPYATVSGTTSTYVGQQITLSVSAIGFGTLSYQWYNDTNSTANVMPNATASTFTETAGAIGTFSYYVIVTDANNAHTQSTPDSQVVVSAAPEGNNTTTQSTTTTQVTTTTIPPEQAQVTVSGTSSVQIGQEIALTTSVTGGTWPFTYQWYNDTTGTPVKIAGATSSTFNATTTAPGTFDYYVVVTDSAEESAKSVPDWQVTVFLTGQTVPVEIVPNTVYVGESTIVSANMIGLSFSNPTYLWNEAGYCPGVPYPGDVQSFNYTPTGTTSTCRFSVLVFDAYKDTGFSTSGTLTAVDPQTQQTQVLLSNGNSATSLGVNVSSNFTVPVSVMGQLLTFSTNNSSMESVNVTVQNVTTNTTITNPGYTGVEVLNVSPLSNDITVNARLYYSCGTTPVPMPFISKDNGTTWTALTPTSINSESAPCYVEFNFSGDPIVGLFTNSASHATSNTGNGNSYGSFAASSGGAWSGTVSNQTNNTATLPENSSTSAHSNASITNESNITAEPTRMEYTATAQVEGSSSNGTDASQTAAAPTAENTAQGYSYAVPVACVAISIGAAGAATVGMACCNKGKGQNKRSKPSRSKPSIRQHK